MPGTLQQQNATAPIVDGGESGRLFHRICALRTCSSVGHLLEKREVS